MKKIIIIGGVAGGASCAARLRRLDEEAQIILIERGEYISYANCGLPYHVGDVIKSRDSLLLQTPETMKNKFNMDVRVQNEVVSIDLSNKTVTVKNIKTGEVYEESYDSLSGHIHRLFPSPTTYTGNRLASYTDTLDCS